MEEWNEEVEELEQQRVRLLENFTREVAQLSSDLDDELSKIDELIALRLSLSGNLKVLKRHTAGPEVTIYHSALRPCGRAAGPGRSRRNFTTTTEAEARREGLKRCSACRWLEHEHEAAKQHRGDSA